MTPVEAVHKQYLCPVPDCCVSTFYPVYQKLGNGSQTGKEMGWRKLQEEVLPLDVVIRYERAEIQAEAEMLPDDQIPLIVK